MTTKTLIIIISTATACLVAPATAVSSHPAPSGVKQITISYTAHNGAASHAVVLLPSWYSPSRNPSIPLVISPHGRGLWGRTNAKLWGSLPTLGGFAVVNPDQAGDHLPGRFAWGAKGDVDDLARMPQIVHSALPWVEIDTDRLYAVGGSMGGQETLLLLGEHPRLLAGAVAVDSLVDFGLQYENFSTFKCDEACLARWGEPIGRALQQFVRTEVGGTPTTAAAQFKLRNVFTYAGAIASSGVPLQIWWSHADKVVVHPELHSGKLAKLIRQINPDAPLKVHTGNWVHTHVLRYDRQLPRMLVGLGLLDASDL